MLPEPRYDPLETDPLDQVFSRANPNPDRIDCPADAVISELAQKKRPIEDPTYDHLGVCSPCYRRFRQLQESYKREGKSLAQRLTIAAAVVLVAVCGAWWVTSHLSKPAQGLNNQTSLVTAYLDLRPYAVSRSDELASDVKPLVLDRKRQRLTIVLPVGAEPGKYQVRLLDNNLIGVVSGTGAALMEDGKTVLSVELDLSGLPAGPHSLALHREGESWKTFPVEAR